MGAAHDTYSVFIYQSYAKQCVWRMSQYLFHSLCYLDMSRMSGA